MKESIKKRYNLLFDELNVLETSFRTYKNVKKSSTPIDDFVDFLIDAYIEGFVGASYLLGEEHQIDFSKITTALNIIYNNESIFDKFSEYFNTDDYEAMDRLLESEVHRMYNTGSFDSASISDKQVMKTWITMGDDLVRDTHRYLEAKSIPLNEHFITNDGDSAYAPGCFTLAQNNVNCRCILDYTIE